MTMMKRGAIEWERPMTEQEQIERGAAEGRPAAMYRLCVVQERIVVDVSAAGFTLPDGSVIPGMAAFKARFPGATIRSL